jgi:hypothetical protein
MESLELATIGMRSQPCVRQRVAPNTWEAPRLTARQGLQGAQAAVRPNTCFRKKCGTLTRQAKHARPVKGTRPRRGD